MAAKPLASCLPRERPHGSVQFRARNSRRNHESAFGFCVVKTQVEGAPFNYKYKSKGKSAKSEKRLTGGRSERDVESPTSSPYPCCLAKSGQEPKRTRVRERLPVLHPAIKIPEEMHR